MERRNFLKLALGVAAGAAAFTTAAQAAPLSPQPIDAAPGANADVRPAVTSSEEIARMKPEEVRWHGGWHHRHWGWRRRHWGWRRRHWRRRYW